jgi:hypothetical protein
MALIIPPGFAQIVFSLSLEGDSELMVTTLGVELDTGSGANVDDIANDMFTAFNVNIMPMLPTTYWLEFVTAYVGQDGPGPLIVESTSARDNGGASGEAVPPNTAWLVRKRTDLAGRRGRGRMYIPGVLEGSVDRVGVVGDTAQGNWQAALDSFYEDLTSAVGARYYPPVVLHRSEGAGVEPAPTPITTLVIDSKVATQRRRLRP